MMLLIKKKIISWYLYIPFFSQKERNFEQFKTYKRREN
jgi:hypothetical protein